MFRLSAALVVACGVLVSISNSVLAEGTVGGAHPPVLKYAVVNSAPHCEQHATKSSLFNDNYCDCGTDEPGTSACSLFTQSLSTTQDGGAVASFQCVTELPIPQLVYLSRVGDGICDCCDGSDEPNGTTFCANTCEEERMRFVRQQEAELAARNAGTSA
jgi:hypothetical protein